MDTESYQAIHAINRPHAPDEATADFIFRAYMLLKSAPPTFGKWARQGAFEKIADCEVSWRVVGISEDALRKIAATGKRADLQRGHGFARDKRYEGCSAQRRRPWTGTLSSSSSSITTPRW